MNRRIYNTEFQKMRSPGAISDSTITPYALGYNDPTEYTSSGEVAAIRGH